MDGPDELRLRELSARALGILVRRHGGFDSCEDAVQEALVVAARDWPRDGWPANPLGWLITVASRRLVEIWRNEAARRGREERYALTSLGDPAPVPQADDTLTLLTLCCHPALTRPAQVALTLRAVGGLTTAEIARALLIPEATAGQRISRAKARIKAAGARFEEPREDERTERLASVLEVLYLIFNEGSTTSSGPALHRVELCAEAIRLTRQLYASLPHEGEVAGLLALMLLTDARRPARTDAERRLIPLAEQDRSRWNRAAIDEGVALLTPVLATAPPGPFQLQAAISAVHDEAASVAETDWPQILGLYDIHLLLAPGPMVTLNRIVAVAMVHGAEVALAELAEAARAPALDGHYRVHAVRAHLLDQVGDSKRAHEEYLGAARRTKSLPEQRYLQARADAARARSDASSGE
ncbi:RNA polymerase sigma factor [Leekyejoonella antrihumi]|uniref:RNA polymerase sigma factor n=1 Tax=Leekyejoonella antrihumi TaxID=1660198 RepID=A0A563E903_9MICO|nr:RNA polymerase sigma factor [Leekyejoonella antrihumi]